MTTWLILAGYLAGTILGARLALTMIMERLGCSKERGSTKWMDICREFHGNDCGKPIGQMRPREVQDGLVALAMGLTWPVVVAVYLIMHSVPPTPGESRRLLADQERRIEAQRKDIERLTRELDR